MPATKKKSTKSTTTSRTKPATSTVVHPDKLALSLAQTKIAEDTVPQQHDPSMGYSALQLEAMLDTFNLDAHSHLQALRRSQAHRLQSLQRHWDTAVESLEPQIRGMLLERFLSEFHGDREAALRGVVEGTLRSRQPPMGRVEESARKRKRTDHRSPARALDTSTDIDDVFSTSKKLRHAVSSSAIKASAKKAAVGADARKPRLRLRPSTVASTSASATKDPHAASSSNFVYRAGATGAFNPALPPTPSVNRSAAAGAGARRPRRGESIVLQSVNGSPLGEFVASDVEDDGEVEDEEEEEGEEEWDLVERNEASRVEEQGKAGGKGKGKAKAKATSSKGKGKPTPAAATAGRATRSRSSSFTQSAAPAPSSNNFAIALPPTAPSYDELKQQVIRGMRADLERRQMSAEERRRLLESLRAFEEGGM